MGTITEKFAMITYTQKGGGMAAQLRACVGGVLHSTVRKSSKALVRVPRLWCQPKSDSPLTWDGDGDGDICGKEGGVLVGVMTRT